MFDRSDEFRGKISYFWPLTPDKKQRVIFSNFVGVLINNFLDKNICCLDSSMVFEYYDENRLNSIAIRLSLLHFVETTAVTDWIPLNNLI